MIYIWIMGKTHYFVAIVLSLSAGQALAGDPCGPGHMRKAEVRGGTLELRWEGRIEEQMGPDIAAEFAKHKRNSKAVTLSLTSCGGGSLSMERTIYVLRDIKATHALATVVERGDICASACVPVFLAGSRRIGALASLWFFHPATVPNRPDRNKILSDDTEDFIRRHFPPTVVSPDWVLFMRRTIRDADLWQTGRDSWESKSGILTETIDNIQPREGGAIDLAPALLCGLLCRG